MPCDIGEMLQRQFYFFGTYAMEERILECRMGQAVGARMILDVGANAGIFSLAALAVEPDATVHAFEPTPEIARRLKDTAALNELERLNVHETAVLGHNGHVTLTRCRGEFGTNDGMNFVSQARKGPALETVESITLDQFCWDHGINHIDLLKIDIQGQEPQALIGASRLLGAGRIGTIFIELNWAPPGDDSCAATQVIRILEGMGYRFSRPSCPLRWRASGTWMRGCADVVAQR